MNTRKHIMPQMLARAPRQKAPADFPKLAIKGRAKPTPITPHQKSVAHVPVVKAAAASC